MVGRTPEYLGKKLGRREVTAAAISILTMPTLVLLGSGIAIMFPSTASAMGNSGVHGWSEVLYAYTSAANNNGSAFGGITVTNGWFQSSLGSTWRCRPPRDYSTRYRSRFSGSFRKPADA